MQQIDEIKFAQPAALDYAAVNLPPPNRRTGAILTTGAVLHLVAGGASALFGVLSCIDSEIFGGALLLFVGAFHLAIGFMLLRRTPRCWRGARMLLGLALVPSIALIGYCAVMFVLLHEKEGWGGFGAAIAVVVGIGASVPFWLNSLTTWYLMRPRSRVLFGIDPTRSFAARKAFMRITWVLWIASVVTVVISASV